MCERCCTCKLHLLTSPPVTLREFLDKSNLSQAEFAARVKVSPAEVSLWLKSERGESGGRRPGLANASKIEAVTGGAIPAAAWIPRRTPARCVARSRRQQPSQRSE